MEATLDEREPFVECTEEVVDEGGGGGGGTVFTSIGRRSLITGLAEVIASCGCSWCC